MIQAECAQLIAQPGIAVAKLFTHCWKLEQT
jgi:hypothetical protein